MDSIEERRQYLHDKYGNVNDFEEGAPDMWNNKTFKLYNEMDLAREGGLSQEEAPLPTKFVPRSAPIRTYRVLVDNICYNQGFGPAGIRWVRGAGPFIELDIREYVDHEKKRNVFLFEAGGREYIHKNKYHGGPWWLENLNLSMFDARTWTISDISANKGGGIRAVHFNAYLDSRNLYNTTFHVNE